MKYTLNEIYMAWNIHKKEYIQSGIYRIKYKSGILTKLNTNAVEYVWNRRSIE